MKLESLTAISPLDGRYRKKVEKVADYFSEYSLIRNRALVEIEYLIALSELIPERFSLSDKQKDALRDIYKNFEIKEAKRVKEIERIVRHDVKSLEYFLRERCDLDERNAEMLHFGLTSEDVNNIVYSHEINTYIKNVYIPSLKEIIKRLDILAQKNEELIMIGRTHGQPASPTTFGKEMANFAARLQIYEKKISSAKLQGKLNGATGNYNSFSAAYPDIDWIRFSEMFVSKFKLEPCLMTTQILPHDSVSDLLRLIIGTNNVILDMDQDIWRYISDGWLRLKTGKEVGSSTMPHKVNPEDFERSEGNIKIANGFLRTLADELQVSRLQRDLSGSTIQRNYGTGFAHTLLSYLYTSDGLNKIQPHEQKIRADMKAHPEIITEGIQTILRREGMKGAYEKLKTFSRGKEITRDAIEDFIDSLDVSSRVRNEMYRLFESYTGKAQELVEIHLRR